MILRILTGLILTASVALAQQGIPSTVKFRVSDETGSPVTNAALDGCFLDFSQSGARTRFNGFTDTNGIFIAKGETVLGVYARFTRDGYYTTTVKQTIEYTRRADGKGYERIDRWDREIPVLFKRIRNPIPMYARHVDNPYVSAFERVGKYSLGRTSSFDIVEGTFLPPYGKGQVDDIAFTWKMTIQSKDGDGLAVDYDTLCEIRMTNIVDGICRGKPDGAENGHLGSAYFSAYEAPAEGYTNVISFYRSVRGTKVESNDDKHYLYYFRIRTQTNEMGQVTNAFYGRICGQINGSFRYYLNPTPNDRNVEFDPKHNLYTNLGEFEQVHGP
jgi:hypothetical protein